MNKFLIIFICVFVLIVLLTGLALTGVISNPFGRRTPAPVFVTEAPVVITAAPLVVDAAPLAVGTSTGNQNTNNDARIASKGISIGRRFFF